MCCVRVSRLCGVNKPVYGWPNANYFTCRICTKKILQLTLRQVYQKQAGEGYKNITKSMNSYRRQHALGRFTAALQNIKNFASMALVRKTT